MAEIVQFTTPNSFRKINETTEEGTIIQLTPASRDWGAIYIDSYDSLYAVNADGMTVARSYLQFLWSLTKAVGKPALAPTISRGVLWVSGLSTLPSGNAEIPPTCHLPSVDGSNGWRNSLRYGPTCKDSVACRPRCPVAMPAETPPTRH
jgi:hypothetical protein